MDSQQQQVWAGKHTGLNSLQCFKINKGFTQIKFELEIKCLKAERLWQLLLWHKYPHRSLPGVDTCSRKKP